MTPPVGRWQGKPMRCGKKPQVCPNCGHSPVADILFGLIDYEHYEQAIARGEVVLGGCCIPWKNRPHWQCTACGMTFAKRDDVS